MKIVVDKKTGFNTPDKQIKINDFRGIIFYDSSFLTHFSGNFNLPAGVYYTDNNIKKLSFPHRTKEIILPKPERNIRLPKFKIIFKPNPNKASIFYVRKEIVFDTSFKKRPLYELFFIYFHELGHLLYRTEYKCDLFAAKEMLDKGYNQSQVGLGQMFTLTQKGFDKIKRKKIMFYHLLKPTLLEQFYKKIEEISGKAKRKPKHTKPLPKGKKPRRGLKIKPKRPFKPRIKKPT